MLGALLGALSFFGILEGPGTADFLADFLADIFVVRAGPLFAMPVALSREPVLLGGESAFFGDFLLAGAVLLTARPPTVYLLAVPLDLAPFFFFAFADFAASASCLRSSSCSFLSLSSFACFFFSCSAMRAARRSDMPFALLLFLLFVPAATSFWTGCFTTLTSNAAAFGVAGRATSWVGMAKVVAFGAAGAGSALRIMLVVASRNGDCEDELMLVVASKDGDCEDEREDAREDAREDSALSVIAAILGTSFAVRVSPLTWRIGVQKACSIEERGDSSWTLTTGCDARPGR